MGWIDITIVAIIGIGALKGFTKGFIHQLASIAGWVVGFLAARALFAVVAGKAAFYFPDVPVTTLRIVVFVAIWIMFPLLFTLVASVITRIAEKLSVGSFNRILGLLFGAAKWMLVVGLLINVLDYLDTDNALIGQAKKEESSFYYPVKNIVGSLLPVAKAAIYTQFSSSHCIQPLGKSQKKILEVSNPLESPKKNFWRFTTPWMSSKKNFGGLQPLGCHQKRIFEAVVLLRPAYL
ncbi:MAG: CvpA family protein [Mediterranea sp.]|jgi:membrane protein required for colicin V production|nr:CvpA family protein [Mediterranea sp.]